MSGNIFSDFMKFITIYAFSKITNNISDFTNSLYHNYVSIYYYVLADVASGISL